jgi:hypothetical protein
MMAEGKIQEGLALCYRGWLKAGTGIHTLQDRYSHTTAKNEPMTSSEHGGTLGLGDDDPEGQSWRKGVVGLLEQATKWMGRDVFNKRKGQATVATQKQLRGLFRTADAADKCNCIEMPDVGVKI